jgi:bifunctional DNA-binding transcriptional regulator/antitoxin component of YhaV-PrlF toxin-antitoxin module
MRNPVPHQVSLGDRGRFVIPAEVRQRHGWEKGTPLVAIDTEDGSSSCPPIKHWNWSALLVYLFRERGSEIVKANLAGCAIGAANWSEVLTKIEGRAARS